MCVRVCVNFIPIAHGTLYECMRVYSNPNICGKIFLIKHFFYKYNVNDGIIKLDLYFKALDIEQYTKAVGTADLLFDDIIVGRIVLNKYLFF